MVPLDEVWITANFKETQLKRMRAGQKAEIHVDSSGRTFKGHVDSIAGATGPRIQLAAAGKRHGQLRQNRAEDSRKNRSRSGREQAITSFGRA